jgi:type IV fimbrial biogenesis protein FimT
MKTKAARQATQRTTQRGLSLIEVAVVLAVTAVLAGTAAPSLADFIGTRRLDAAAAQLATDIQFVRTDAVARNQPVRLSFFNAAEGSCYVIHTGAAALCSCAASGPANCTGGAVQLKTVQLPARDKVGVQANTGSVLFDPLHGTASPTATVRLLGMNGRTVHHIVNVMGRVRSCSPLNAMPGYAAC